MGNISDNHKMLNLVASNLRTKNVSTMRKLANFSNHVAAMNEPILVCGEDNERSITRKIIVHKDGNGIMQGIPELSVQVHSSDPPLHTNNMSEEEKRESKFLRDNNDAQAGKVVM